MHDDAPHSARPSIDAPTTSGVTQHPVPRALKNALDAVLVEDEAVLWRGQPMASLWFQEGCGLWVLGLPWTASSVFMMWIVRRAWAPGAFALVPFVMAGVAMLLAPLLSARSARRTLYVVTNHRLLVIEKRLLGAKVTRTFPTTVLEVKLRSTGCGSLVFERTPSRGGRYKSTFDDGFSDIRDAAAVGALITRTFAMPSRSP